MTHFPERRPQARSRAVALVTAILVVLGLLTGVAPTASAAVAGSVTAWGESGSDSLDVPPSLDVDGVTAIAAGSYHTLALTPAGKVVTWGHVYGPGTTTVPASLASRTVVAVAAGSNHSLALTSDGDVVGWGDNSYGQALTPPSLAGRKVTAIAAGGFVSLALTSDGRVVGWGDDRDHQATIPASLDGTTVTAIATGGSHSLALTSDGQVVEWGYTDSGGWGPPSSLTGKRVTAIAAGGSHSLALTSDGKVTVWGDGSLGQLAVPASLAAKTVTAIDASVFHSLVLTSDGQVVAWGDDTYGESDVPASLTGRTVIAIAAGQRHDVVLTRRVALAVVAPPQSVRAQRGVPVSFTAAAVGDPVPTVQWQRTDYYGSFYAISGATGSTYTVTPGSGDDGALFRAVFTNATGSVTTSPATLTVNQPPRATGFDVTTGSGTPTPVTLAGTDPNGDPLTYAVVSGPGHGTLTGSAPRLTYTPVAGYSGLDTFTYRANDGTLNSTPATVNITVTKKPDQAPTATPLDVTTAFATPAPVTLSGTDPDADPLTYAVVTGPAHGTLTGSPPRLTYTPAAGYSGSDTFTYRANDGTLDSTPATVRITVSKRPDQSPTASPLDVTTAFGAPTPVTLTGTDPDADPLTYAVVNPPAHGTLTGSAPRLTYTSAAGYSGSDTFTYRANDGTLDSTAATVNITVAKKPDQAPTANPLDLTTGSGSPTPVALSGTDPDADPLTYAVVTGPTHGALTGSPPALTYTPAAGYSGPDTFTYLANDGTLDSAPATVHITVTAPPCVPTPPRQTFRVDAGGRDATGVFSSPQLTTREPGVLLLAFVTANGPAKGVQTVKQLSGGGLTWTLAQRDDTTAGTSEVWQAYAAGPLGPTRVTATLAVPGQSVSLTVAGFSHAQRRTGATAHRSGKKSAPQVSLRPRSSGSLVWAVGRAVGSRYKPKPVSGQKVVHASTAKSPSSGSWTQLSTAVTRAGVTVVVADKAKAKSWGYAAVEVPAAC